MQTARIRQNEIHFEDKGTGPAVLLVHGFPLDHSMWHQQFDALSLRYRVIAPDLPGFGLSPLGQHDSLGTQDAVGTHETLDTIGPSNVASAGQQSETTETAVLSLPGMAKILIGLMDHLEIDKTSFCGLSMGGYIGWQFWRLFANRLVSLIACNTRAAADNETMMRARKLSAQNARAEGIPKLADDMIPRLFAPAYLQGKSDEVNRIRNVISSTNPESVAQALLAMAERPDATPWLSQIQVPTLFVAGSEDVITPAAEMRGNAEQVQGAKFAEIKGAGHMSPMENPAEFNQILNGFLDSL